MVDKLRRNHLLTTSDWTQLPDSPLTEEQKQAWREYRQLLRDLPDNNWNWPVPPPLPGKIPMSKL
jgi:hypothetical protein